MTAAAAENEINRGHLPKKRPRSLSEVMKRLTAITAVLAGVGAAAGIFGMREAASALGPRGSLWFWVVVLVVLAIGLAVFMYFRRIDWM